MRRPLRKLRNETGALIAYYKPYAERYLGMIKDVLEGPTEETPGWHAGELETSQCLCHNPKIVRMDRAVCEYPARVDDPGALRPEAAPAVFAWKTVRMLCMSLIWYSRSPCSRLDGTNGDPFGDVHAT